MLMPKKNRQSIYEYLFKEGVIVARKDFHAPKHPDIVGVPNLQVIKALQVFLRTRVKRTRVFILINTLRNNVVARYL